MLLFSSKRYGVVLFDKSDIHLYVVQKLYGILGYLSSVLRCVLLSVTQIRGEEIHACSHSSETYCILWSLFFLKKINLAVEASK